MPLENKVVSSQEVALAAGVSRTVVSWVVNGTAAQHRVTKATEQRVKAAVAQLNYEPSRFLRGKELPPGGELLGLPALSLSKGPVDKLLSKFRKVPCSPSQQLNNLAT
jgi:hypothetical protein